MEHENKNVFRYVEQLLKGHLCNNYNIGIFASKHNDIDPKLKDLKDIIIRYYPQKDNELLNSVLYDIINCEHDLYFHCLDRASHHWHKRKVPAKKESPAVFLCSWFPHQL